jgi:hypothetical protein
MEDLKIVLYIVAAIGWVIYNNYKKITNEASKRDVRRPVSEIPTENWPIDRPVKTTIPEVIKEVPRQPVPVRPAIKRPQPIRRQSLIAKKGPVAIPEIQMSAPEGGRVLASSQVTFTEVHDNVVENEHPWLEEFRSGTDWRKMLVGAEILQRPTY